MVGNIVVHAGFWKRFFVELAAAKEEKIFSDKKIFFQIF